MALLGGSPLGLVGITSQPNNGMSTFNGGKSRNINVNQYNSGKNSITGGGSDSIFTGYSRISPYGLETARGGKTNNMGLETIYTGVSRSLLHNDSIYDTSIINIIEKLANTEAQLRPSDFAYLRDVGVYPNNRLMIARRFATPHSDNIYGKGEPPRSVMISWKPEGEDFVDITFGEKWKEASADFTDVLNSLGKDISGKAGSGLGDKLGGGLDGITLPGFSETAVRNMLESLGILEEGDFLPSGNPNLIKEAMRRETVGAGDKGSGLKCDVNIKMSCEWEQKFISGVDPTIVYQDILSKILIFGTSPSVNYGLNKGIEGKLTKWMNNPKTLIDDIIRALSGALTSMRDSIVNLISGTENVIKNADDKLLDTNALKINAGLKFDAILANINGYISQQIKKYEIEIIGITRALSGAPSTPWHITLGNPLRPTFCAGDMITTDVKITLGSSLSFNDLPSTIKAEFTLKNARPWGLQEIMAKFNSGYIRSVIAIKDSSDISQSGNNAELFKPPTKVTTPATNQTANSSSEGANISNNPAPIVENSVDATGGTQRAPLTPINVNSTEGANSLLTTAQTDGLLLSNPDIPGRRNIDNIEPITPRGIKINSDANSLIQIKK